MSSTSITVNPRRKTAQSPPPAVSRTTTTSHTAGTVLLRNPLPKYSFERKSNGRKDKAAVNVVPEEKDAPKDIGNEDKDSSVHFKDTVCTVTDVTGDELSGNPLPAIDQKSVAFGKLVGSFPQTVIIPDSLTVDNGNVTVKVSKSESYDSHQKPVNKVGPLHKNSETALSHSVSDSALGFQQLMERVEVSAASTVTVSAQEHSQSIPNQSGVCAQTKTKCADCTTTSDSEAVCQGVRLATQSATSSQLTGGCRCSEKITQLEEEKQLLKNQLEVQLQVNQELKKLLVASVGDDLQHRVEKITRDKALLSLEIGDFTKKMHEDYEHLDKISIQADMWRSKYLACRVMADELASSKAFYCGQFHECQMAIEKLLSERHQLRTSLYDTYRGLSQIQEAFDPLGSQTSGSRLLTSKNNLDLGRTNQHLVETIKYRLLPSHVTSSISNKMEIDWHDYLTQAEAHAQELLSRELRPEDFRSLIPSRHYVAAPGGLTVDRFHPFAKFDNLTLNVCCKCKGEICIV